MKVAQIAVTTAVACAGLAALFVYADAGQSLKLDALLRQRRPRRLRELHRRDQRSVRRAAREQEPRVLAAG